MKETRTITEIARSFSYKLNLGNYQMADFFCSQKAEALTGEEEWVSEALYRFCKTEVMKSVSDYKEELNYKKAEPVEPINPEIPDEK